MTLFERINVKMGNVDRTTGEELTHEEVYTRAINALGGLYAVIPYIPFSLERIKNAFKEGDKDLNTLPLRTWDEASGYFQSLQGKMLPRTLKYNSIWELYRKNGINSASCAQGVCILKETARQWAMIG